MSEHEWEKMYQASLVEYHSGMRRVIPCAVVSLSPQCQGRPFWAMDGTGAARSLSVERSRARRPNSSTSSRYARIPVRHIDCQLLKALNHNTYSTYVPVAYVLLRRGCLSCSGCPPLRHSDAGCASWNSPGARREPRLPFRSDHRHRSLYEFSHEASRPSWERLCFQRWVDLTCDGGPWWAM